MNKYLICTTICALFFVACQQSNKQSERSKKQIIKGESFSFKPVIKYATCFNIELHDGYKTIMVNNPWKKQDTLASYTLYPKGTTKPHNLPSVDFEIPVPIGEIATLSSTHIGFIDLLGELDKIVGVSAGNRIYNKRLSEKS